MKYGFDFQDCKRMQSVMNGEVDHGIGEKELMKKIQELSFVLYDTALYLDAYPRCKDGISYYNAMKEKLEELTREYESKFAPLTMKNGVKGDSWVWTSGKFPWQYNEEG